MPRKRTAPTPPPPPEYVPSPFGRRLRQLREAAGLSVAALARTSGVHPQVLYELEKGRKVDPQWKTVRLVAAALGVSTDEFVPE
jgi:transcriptional regulator with XRE-family HTH domain